MMPYFTIFTYSSIVIMMSVVLISCEPSTKGIISTPGQVEVKQGLIEGIVDLDQQIESYLGIPYAAPPIGDLRWKAPATLASWTGVREATAFGPRPMQIKLWDDLNYQSTEMSEDCLYLNVWRPINTEEEQLPVLVYIHGGGLVAGDGSEKRYDGASMAKKGIVVVTINYRLNIFGNMAHQELSQEADYGASGNYGYLDQVAALQWVQDNISSFGGNPQNVTIAGESAGSVSVAAHMASPLSQGLIAGAIGESGAPIKPTLAPVSLAEAEEYGDKFLTATGRSSIEDLRALSAEALFELYKDNPATQWFPSVIDGHFFDRPTIAVFEASAQAQIPLLVGWNSAEISAQGFMGSLEFTTANFIKTVRSEFKLSANEILKNYPHSTPEEVEISATHLASDRFIAYSTWKWSDLHRKHSVQPVYRYLYSKLRPPLVKDSSRTDLPIALGAPHACEIEYCMGNLHLLDDYWAWSSEDYAVSETMQDYFANFIKTGDPNGPSLSTWPAVSPTDPTPEVMIIDVNSASQSAEADIRYEVLDKFYNPK